MLVYMFLRCIDKKRMHLYLIRDDNDVVDKKKFRRNLMESTLPPVLGTQFSAKVITSPDLTLSKVERGELGSV